MTTLVNVLAINRYPDSMARRSTWIAVALAIAVLAIVIVVIASAWSGLGDTGMSAGGWAALVLGVTLIGYLVFSAVRGNNPTALHAARP